MQRLVPNLLNASRQPHRDHGRSGFSLVELMIVIAIIAFLLSVLGVVSMSMIGGARVSATKATMVKVQGLIQQRVDAATRKDPDPVMVDALSPLFGRKPAESIARKLAFRQAFPQTWAEIPTKVANSLPAGSPPFPSPAPAVSPQRQACESSEVLLFMLTKANVLGYPPEGLDTFASSEIQDTDQNGWPELVDAWGQPLRFYRWPTRLVRGGPWVAGGFTPSATARLLIPSLPTTMAELTHDPDDRYGFLKVRDMSNPAAKFALIQQSEVTNYEQGNGGMASIWFNRGAFNTPETYSLPLIVSGGPDKLTGLFEPSDSTVNLGYWGTVDPTAISATFDDISNYNIRSGGK
jgi:prepilin-type N-terminal cleavage/methylation domain-containing protein